MLLGKRPRAPMQRTTSLSDINSHLPTSTSTATSDPNRQIPDQTPPDFLRSCSLCNLTLIPSRDIYMYRGDSAFCSVECRQQAMNRDERKEKCSFASKKKIAPHHQNPSKLPSNVETVGAL